MDKNNQKNILNYFEKKSDYYQNIKNSLLFVLIKKKELEIFKKNVHISSSDSVIDLASGSGFYINEIAKNNPKEICAIDFSQKMLDKIKLKKIKKINSNIEKLNLNKKFDIIFCFGLLEFCSNTNIVFQKIKDLSKNNSKIYLIFPRNNFFGLVYRFYHLINGLNIKLKSYKTIQNELNKNNLKIIKKYNTFLSTFVVIGKNG